MKKAILTLLTALATAALAACGNTTETPQAPPSDLPRELTVATLAAFQGGNPFLEHAAQRFMELNDGVTVNIVAYDNRETYAQIINTALISGGGEDIINLRNLQWQRLADTQRLVDMSGKLTLSPGEFYTDALDAFLYNGRRYAVPMAFAIPAFQATELLAPALRPANLTLENLVAVSNAHPDTLLFWTATGLGSNPISIASMFFELEFCSFVDMANRAANINEDFVALLEAVDSIAHNLRHGQPGEEALFAETFMHSPAMSLNGFCDFGDFILATNRAGGGLMWPGDYFGINANSQNPQLAAQFIRFLLSEEIQSSPELFQTPVNRAVAVVRATDIIESTRAHADYAGFTDGFDLPRNITFFNDFARHANVLGFTDSMIRNFVNAEMARFFNGEVTAAQAAENLQIRLTTYLNE